MKKEELKYIIFEVTPSCNLNCTYCYNPWKRPGETSGLKNTYAKSIKVLKRLFKTADVSSVTFTGGEPMLAERFPEIVLFCKMKKKNVTVISNGNWQEQEDYLQLINLGVGLFELPVHSAGPKIHDRMTGKQGSWAQTVSSIKFLVANGANVVVDIVLCKQNYRQLDETVKFIKSLGISQIMLTRFNIGGNGINNADSLLMNKEELNTAFHTANELIDKYNVKITSNVCTPFCVLNPADFPNIRLSSCSAELRSMPTTMDIEGNLRICNHSPVRMGNIFSDKLTDIINSGYAKDWKNIVPEYCSVCKLWQECYGGCRAASEQLGNGLFEPDPLISQD